MGDVGQGASLTRFLLGCALFFLAISGALALLTPFGFAKAAGVMAVVVLALLAYLVMVWLTAAVAYEGWQAGKKAHKP